MATAPVKMELSLDTRSQNAIRRLTDALEKCSKAAQRQGTVIHNHPAESEEYHNENTLGKVYAVLMGTQLNGGPGVYLDQQEASNIVSAMQNAGILFRERKS